MGSPSHVGHAGCWAKADEVPTTVRVNIAVNNNVVLILILNIEKDCLYLCIIDYLGK